MNLKNIFTWTLRIVSAAILLQTLFFKFSGHPESVELFTKLGVEPWGRIGTGILELITGFLLLISSSVFVGALLGMGLMAGAIFSHLTVLGIESKGDGGQLFMLASIVFAMCSILAVIYKEQGKSLLSKFVNRKNG